MVDIVYPSSLRVPQTSSVTPAERRALSQSDRPREARARERDRRKFERVQFRPMTPAEAQIFRDWWTDDLVLGGAWFEANWPLPEGYISAVRKFVGVPRWEYIPGGMWRVSAFTEVRGSSLTPTQPLPSGAATGWANPVDSAAGTVARANTGTYAVDFLGEIFEFLDFHAGIVGYTSGAASWSLSWLPTFGAPAPTKTELAGGVVRLRFANQDYPFQNVFNGVGLATLTATLDGSPTDAGVEIAVSDGEFGYGFFAWQPVP